MGILDFFKRNKKSKTETVKTSKPSPEQTFFAETVLEIISPTVETFGFKRHRTEIEKHFTTSIFRKDKQYIKISGSTYPTDYPYSYNVILGEGDSEDFSEWDWNSIALWRLKTKIDPKAKAKEYEFPYGDKVKFSVSNANNELLKYADTFLHGDMTLFYETVLSRIKTESLTKFIRLTKTEITKQLTSLSALSKIKSIVDETGYATNIGFAKMGADGSRVSTFVFQFGFISSLTLVI